MLGLLASWLTDESWPYMGKVGKVMIGF